MVDQFVLMSIFSYEIQNIMNYDNQEIRFCINLSDTKVKSKHYVYSINSI